MQAVLAKSYKKRIVDLLSQYLEVLLSIEGIKSCFDAIVKGRKELYILKILYNLDSFEKEEAISLNNFSQLVNAKPFIIAKNSNNGELEEQVIFERFSVPAGRFSTFLSFVEGKPLARKRAKKFYSISGERLRELRLKKGFSLSKLSLLTGISKETLYRYEHNLVSPSKENLLELSKHLGSDLTSKAVVEKEENKQTDRVEEVRAVKLSNPLYSFLLSKTTKFFVGKERSKKDILRKYNELYSSLSLIFGVQYFFISSRPIPFPYIEISLFYKAIKRKDISIILSNLKTNS